MARFPPVPSRPSSRSVTAPPPLCHVAPPLAVVWLIDPHGARWSCDGSYNPAPTFRRSLASSAPSFSQSHAQGLDVVVKFTQAQQARGHGAVICFRLKHPFYTLPALLLDRNRRTQRLMNHLLVASTTSAAFLHPLQESQRNFFLPPCCGYAAYLTLPILVTVPFLMPYLSITLRSWSMSNSSVASLPP